MVAGLDRDEDADIEPDAVLVDQCNAFLNDAVGLEPLDTLPARRRGQSHARADFGHGKRGIILQNGKYLAVYGIHEIYSSND